MPSEVRGLVVGGSIVIELPPSKGIVFEGENLLIDHHNNAPPLQYYVGSRTRESQGVGIPIRAVVEIALKVTGLDGTLPQEARNLVEAVCNIDQGVYKSSLENDLHHAYLLEIADPTMRIRVTEWVRRDAWDELHAWAERGRDSWIRVENRTDELVSSSKVIRPGVAYFSYSSDNIDLAAMRNAMLRLEHDFPIVIAIQVNSDGLASRMSIGSKKDDIDLTPMLAALRQYPGVTAGGRRTIGGAQFPEGVSLDQVLSWIVSCMDAVRG
ncbi:MAG: hypothetical protein ACTSUH_12465 [Candidatus Thorarchaeota archaeon]